MDTSLSRPNVNSFRSCVRAFWHPASTRALGPCAEPAAVLFKWIVSISPFLPSSSPALQEVLRKGASKGCFERVLHVLHVLHCNFFAWRPAVLYPLTAPGTIEAKSILGEHVCASACRCCSVWPSATVPRSHPPVGCHSIQFTTPEAVVHSVLSVLYIASSRLRKERYESGNKAVVWWSRNCC
ncbi:hypothetical protein BDZ91DRAFT_62694 [Kalaharituber pfeilii]|nr:hypothetical protein BDZ91DRAFT_62694 [Kalaharituber pfeilii]